MHVNFTANAKTCASHSPTQAGGSQYYAHVLLPCPAHCLCLLMCPLCLGAQTVGARLPDTAVQPQQVILALSQFRHL